MKLFHFSLGNSADQAIGFCAGIMAKDKAAATARLKAVLDEVLGEMQDHELNFDKKDSGEHITIYFNTKQITADDIDDHEDI